MNNNIYNNSLRKEIVDKADIVGIISEYVSLEKKGANYIGLCPFHEDKNPSMSVSPTKKVFKCFSCNTGGDVITFVSKIKNISSRDAMRIVGETIGISVNVTKKELERQKNSKYYDLMQETSSFYNFYLKNATNAKKALEYLHNRGLKNEIINRFQIGLSDENDELFKLLESKNFLPVDMIEVGLIRSIGNSYKDVFKNRIIFPIWDLDGNICGFSGRRYLENDKDSKYLNTNETIIFKKGQILYNYHNAISKIKSENCVFLFEGFMDVIASVRSGMENSVASMGTALTTMQIDALCRLTNNIIIGYDSDEPGIMATLRAIDMLSNYDVNIKVISIPDGKDPDEYIKKNGEEVLYSYLKNNQISAMDFIYKVNLRSTPLDDINSKEVFKNIIFSNLKKFKSNTLIETFIKKMSSDLNISVSNITEDYQNFKENVKNLDKNYHSSLPEIVKQEDIEVEIKQKKFASKNYGYKKFVKCERELIRALFNDKLTCLEIDASLNSDFVEKDNRDLRFAITQYYLNREVINKDEFIKNLEPKELIDILEDILSKENNTLTKDVILNDIAIVKRWKEKKKVQENLSNGKVKTIEDLNEISEIAHKQTTLKRKGKGTN